MDDDAQPVRRALPPVPPVGAAADRSVVGEQTPAPPITRRGRHAAAPAPEAAVPLAPVRRRMTDLERTTGSHRPVRTGASGSAGTEPTTTGSHRAVTETGSHRALPPERRGTRRRWVPAGVAGAVGSGVLTALLVSGAFAADEGTEPAAEVGPASTSSTTTTARPPETTSTAPPAPTSAAPTAAETTPPPAPTTTAQTQRSTAVDPPAPRTTAGRTSTASSAAPTLPPTTTSTASQTSSSAPVVETTTPTTGSGETPPTEPPPPPPSEAPAS